MIRFSAASRQAQACKYVSSMRTFGTAAQIVEDEVPPVVNNTVQETPLSEIERIFQLQRANRLNVARSTAQDRKDKLKKLHDVVLQQRQNIREAIREDKGNHASEVDITEIFAVTSECKHNISKLGTWMKPRRVWTPLSLLGSSSWIHPEAKGVTMIMSPWNFPLNLTLCPLISAVAAGNTAILKPSEMSANTSRVIRSIVEEIFEENEVAVVDGAVETSTNLLAQPFDHIFFTGAPSLGKIVMEAAAKNLTSVTLELGGKSPVIIDETADLDTAAKRLVWAKTINSGQTCIAPDYIFVHESKKDELLQHFGKWVKEFFKGDTRNSSDYSRIVNERHHQRLDNMYQDALSTGAKVEQGGGKDAADNYWEPTLFTNAGPDSEIMTEEIFGPFLPIVTYKSLEEPIAHINANEKPLAMYIFSKNDENQQHLINSTSAGATVINHCIIHFLNHNLPFGGVNNSGIGKSHGIHGFKEFVNEKAILKQWSPIAGTDLMTPPYNGLKQRLIDLTIKLF